MVEPVKVWVGVRDDFVEKRSVRKSEDMVWAALFREYASEKEELQSRGWTVRPMTLLDGHGEQGE